MNEDKEIELFRIIAKATSKEKKMYLSVAIFILLLGSVIFYYGYRTNPACIIASLILIVTGVKLLYDKLNEPSGFQSPIIILLTRNKKNIVWIYSIVKENMPFGVKLLGSGRMIMKTLDKKEFSISVSQAELSYLNELFMDYMPHVTFGYSMKKENMYGIDPYLLLSSIEED